MKWVCYDGRNHFCYRAGKVLLIIGPVGIQCSCRNRRILLQKGNETQIVQMRKDLEDLTSSFGMKVTDRKVNLTPREIEVCNLVKNGLSSKENCTNAQDCSSYC